MRTIYKIWQWIVSFERFGYTSTGVLVGVPMLVGLWVDLTLGSEKVVEPFGPLFGPGALTGGLAGLLLVAIVAFTPERWLPPQLEKFRRV